MTYTADHLLGRNFTFNRSDRVGTVRSRITIIAFDPAKGWRLTGMRGTAWVPTEMLKRLFEAGVLASLVLAVACSSPTAPSKPDPTVATTTVQPAPEPTPEPAAPAPVPTPAPTPRHEPTWTATTDHGVLPREFPVEWRYTTLWFGELTAPIMLQNDRSIFARTDAFSIQIVLDGNNGSWTFNGLSGQASGTLIYR